jgi:DNA repair protein RecN (Recombination protein N)
MESVCTMLEELHIQNFAIIDDLTVRFGPGLNVLTGETGAGKSILIGALEILLGARGRTDRIREGADEAVVEGLFDLRDQPELADVLEEHGFDRWDEVLLRRVVSKGGKSRAYVNDRLCTLQALGEMGRIWVNIYGQHEHQSLLQPERHLDLLDGYGELGMLRGRWEQLWSEWDRLETEIRDIEKDREEAAARRDLWEFQCAEIENAHLRPGEEEELEKERQRLSHAQRIREGLFAVEEALYGERGSALERVQNTSRILEDLQRFDSDCGSIAELLDTAAVQIEEAVQQTRVTLRRAETDPQRLQIVEDRLAEIQRLKRKYKDDVAGILRLQEDLRRKLNELGHGEAKLEDLRREQKIRAGELFAAGRSLTKGRQEWGLKLAEGVERELRDLGIDRPVFKVEMMPLNEGRPVGPAGEKGGPRGMDRVTFMLSTNVGESPRPLAGIASGGELSRIMLALKKVLAEAEKVPTLVFDEIDAGIGGAVAEALGEKLSHIAQRYQVLCITHLPQLACYARGHFRVAKGRRGQRTITRVEPLEPEDRVEEISRMLGGKVITERTRAHARELLHRAQ